MPIARCLTVIVLFAVLSLTGCYSKSMRHLASDVALITIGESVRNDVLTYLGEPDKQNKRDGDTEEWIYVEEKITTLQRIPMIGVFFSNNGYQKITVILHNNVVQSCQYREFDKDELEWADDYSWQEIDA